MPKHERGRCKNTLYLNCVLFVDRAAVRIPKHRNDRCTTKGAVRTVSSKYVTTQSQSWQPTQFNCFTRIRMLDILHDRAAPHRQPSNDKTIARSTSNGRFLGGGCTRDKADGVPKDLQLDVGVFLESKQIRRIGLAATCHLTNTVSVRSIRLNFHDISAEWTWTRCSVCAPFFLLIFGS